MSSARDVPLPRAAEHAEPSRGAALARRLLSTLVLLPLFVWMVVDGPVWLFGAVMVLAGALAHRSSWTLATAWGGIRCRRTRLFFWRCSDLC